MRSLARTTSLCALVMLAVLCALVLLAKQGGWKEQSVENPAPGGSKGTLPETGSIERRGEIDSDDAGLMSGSEVLEGRETQPFDSSLSRLAGKLDVKNRYSSVVIVSPYARQTSDSMAEDQEMRQCSGVMLGSRLVLTAGHCLCLDKKGAASLSGETHSVGRDWACAKSALVTTVVYSKAETGRLSTETQEYVGGVQLHPEFALEVDGKGKILKRAADLAVVVLDEPVEMNFMPVPLASAGIQPDEWVVVVGYGYDKNTSGVNGQRRFQSHRVIKYLGSEQLIVFEQSKRDLYAGDSGGPCLRETARGEELAGISARGMGEEAACTSLIPYRAWVVDVVARASQEKGGNLPKSP